MKQKRKVKNLNPSMQIYKKSEIKMGVILAGCIFSLCAISLLTSTTGAVGRTQNPIINGVLYSGFDDKTEVLYEVNMITDGKENKIYHTNNYTTIVNSKKVTIKSEGTSNNNEYGNILGGNNNEIGSDNITVIAGSNNKVSENSKNSTIFGGNSNKIEVRDTETQTPSVIVGGTGNTINKNGLVILGGSGNKNNENNSLIIGGTDNKINKGYAIVGGVNNIINQEKIFSFSNNGRFEPKMYKTFYLYLQRGLGINTGANKGVASKGAISIGEIDIDNLGCNNNIYGLQGNMEGCLVGCTGSGWDLMDYSKECISICSNHSSCSYYKDEEKIKRATASCTDINTENTILCTENKYEAYNNSIFESSYIDSTEKCPGKENKCVYRCNSDSHLIEDKTGKHNGEKRCFKNCELPSSYSEDGNPKIVKHNEKYVGYTKVNTEKIKGHDNSYLGNRCEEYKQYFVCNNGDWYTSNENGIANYKFEDEFFKDCDSNKKYECQKEEEQDYNLTNTELYIGSIYTECYKSDVAYYKLLKCDDGYSMFENDYDKPNYEFAEGKYKCMKDCEIDENPLKHTEKITGYSGNNEICPNICSPIELTCYDGNLKDLNKNFKDGNNKSYNEYKTKCTLSEPKNNCNEYNISEYDLDETNTKYEDCTKYNPRSYNNTNCNPEKKYKIKSCSDGYHEEVGKNSCVENTD